MVFQYTWGGRGAPSLATIGAWGLKKTKKCAKMLFFWGVGRWGVGGSTLRDGMTVHSTDVVSGLAYVGRIGEVYLIQ